ncbi:MAG: hypothetical protein LQ343_002879 [Gyalolechia ehrenbergii]|nr:MAG: hypothetical protein LQ343_002879 [Gyalolechia ehrenbergii]
MSTPTPSPPPTSTNENETDIDIASAMGFSSFGSQPQAKKRKFAHPPRQPGSEASGGNASGGGNKIPLGKGREREGAAEKPVQIGGTGVGMGVPGEGVEGGATAAEEGVEKGGREGVRVEEAVGGEGEAMRRFQTAEETRRECGGVSTPGMEGSGARGMEGRAVLGRVLRGAGFQGHSWKEWREGVKDERGDVAFFDASFVEDPWRGLGSEGCG